MFLTKVPCHVVAFNCVVATSIEPLNRRRRERGPDLYTCVSLYTCVAEALTYILCFVVFDVLGGELNTSGHRRGNLSFHLAAITIIYQVSRREHVVRCGRRDLPGHDGVAILVSDARASI